MRKLFFAVLLLLAWCHKSVASEVLVLTDMHFNPLADSALAEPLAASPAEEWPAILDRGRERMSNYSEDSDWKLLRASLEQVRTQKKPDVVLIAGDFLAHGFRTTFDHSFAAHDDAAYHRFVIKTMRFIALEVENALPKTPILPALGNNDSDCGDYAIQPGGAYLADTEAIVAGMVGPSLIKGQAGEHFAQSWTALGNYAIDDPPQPGFRVIGLNDNYFSTHYRDTCGGDGDGNPGRATLAWLNRALAEAAAAHRKVILLYHIPPGTDAFATTRHDACPVSPVPLMSEPYAEELHRTMERYRDTIAANIAGHLHTDAFRILRSGDRRFGFVMIAPAISPIFGQNPSFRRFVLNDDGTISDVNTYYLANLGDAVAGATPQWRAEASFERTWNLARFDTASLETLYHRLDHSEPAQQRWIQTYGVQGPASAAVTLQNFSVYRCSVGSDQSGDFARCLCGGGS
ncbi:MAG TPA: metallophosphoesterase [Stellaceae bacterium]|nr:metallophosphoesterase [Stellaceae bacterium]